MFRGAFSAGDKPKDCCSNCQWAVATRTCPVSTDEVAVVPWLIDKFFPFRSFMKIERYNDRISKEELTVLCDYLNKSVRNYPDVPPSCCVLGLTIPFITLAPAVAVVLMIFASVVIGLVFLLIVEIFLSYVLYNSCSSRAKQDQENKKARRQILERAVNHLNTNTFLDSDFSIYFVYDHKENYHYIKIEVVYVMGDYVKPNRARYGIQGQPQRQRSQNYGHLNQQYAQGRQRRVSNNQVAPVMIDQKGGQYPPYYPRNEKEKAFVPPQNHNYDDDGNRPKPQVNMSYPLENGKDLNGQGHEVPQ